MFTRNQPNYFGDQRRPVESTHLQNDGHEKYGLYYTRVITKRLREYLLHRKVNSILFSKPQRQSFGSMETICRNSYISFPCKERSVPRSNVTIENSNDVRKPWLDMRHMAKVLSIISLQRPESNHSTTFALVQHWKTVQEISEFGDLIVIEPVSTNQHSLVQLSPHTTAHKAFMVTTKRVILLTRLDGFPSRQG